jgi:hypothetical protein
MKVTRSRRDQVEGWREAEILPLSLFPFEFSQLCFSFPGPVESVMAVGPWRQIPKRANFDLFMILVEACFARYRAGVFLGFLLCPRGCKGADFQDPEPTNSKLFALELPTSISVSPLH